MLVQDGQWYHIQVGKKGIHISCLLFVDDMLLFAEATMDQLYVIQECLDYFCDASCQRVSVPFKKKKKIIFSNNIANQTWDVINTISGFTRTNNPSKYLVIPLLHARVTKETYSYIIQKVQVRLSGWNTTQLSIVGRITLCKTI